MRFPIPIVRVLLVLVALASPAFAENGAGNAAAAQQAAQDFRHYIDGVAKRGERPDLTRPEVAELLDRVFDLEALNELPPAHGTDLPWLLDWIEAANATYKLIIGYGMKPGPQPDLQAIRRNAAEYGDQIAAASNFLVRGLAREAVAGTRFMAALKPEERTHIREQGLDGLRTTSAEFVLATICSVSESKPANARLVAAAIRDTREVWASFFLGPIRPRVIATLDEYSSRVGDEKARADLATFKDTLATADAR